MSFALSLAPQSHVFNDDPFNRPRAFRSTSTGTVRYYGCRQVSSASLPLEQSAQMDPLYSSHENISTPHVSAQSPEDTTRSTSANKSSQRPRKAERGTNRLLNQLSLSLLSDASFHSLPIDDKSKASTNGVHGVRHTSAAPNAIPWFETGFQTPGFTCDENALPKEPAVHIFKRWLTTLRRVDRPFGSRTSKYQRLPSDSTLSNDRRKAFQGDPSCAEEARGSTSSPSSMTFVRAVRSATVTATNSTLHPRSWMGNRLGQLRRSGTSRSARTSHESTFNRYDAIVDEKAWARALQRRRILEELIESEESYVADMKVLVNVYLTVLTALGDLSTNTRASVRQNVMEILQMHESLLGDLYNVIPYSHYRQNQAQDPPMSCNKGHVRWHSADDTPARRNQAWPGRRLRRSLDVGRPIRHDLAASVAETKTCAAVALVFDKFVGQLFVYEEYGARYEMMVQDLAARYNTLSASDAFERGIEILSRTLESINARTEHTKKGMTFADLAIKPIQRVCKYPLLFADLCKQTHVVDDPEAHAELEKILFRLKEATCEINRATNDPKTRDLIQKTWLLHDRLIFNCQVSPAVLARVLGHVQLCGVLHVAYHTKSGVMGEYMLCALFKFCLVLAVGEKGLTSFRVVASIPLVTMSIQDSDNGRGLQCHTAPFSWKIVFELDYRLYEIMLSACSPLEEYQWRKYINERSCIESLDPVASQTATQDFHSVLNLDLKSIGTLYGHPHPLARRISICRAATVSPKSQLNQVIIRNTYSMDQISRNSHDVALPLNRSQSMLSTGHAKILAPRRSERIKLELVLSDVWTKEILHFPGMKQTENSLRASANHVMRKLSIASITSTISKRTSSLVNFTKPEPKIPTNMDFSCPITRTPTPDHLSGPMPPRPAPCRSVTSPPPKTVDFHQTPEMFLPPDFELKHPRLLKTANPKSTIRAVSGSEKLGSVAHNCARPIVKLSGSKLRRNLDGQFPPETNISVASRPLITPLGAELCDNFRPPSGTGVTPAVKENLPRCGRPMRPKTTQLRRFFN